MTNATTAYAKDVTVSRLAGQGRITENAFGRDLGFFAVIRGFAHFTGYEGTSCEGVHAVVRGGTEGLVKALSEGLVSGRDDRR